jgi:hypothetical protein
VADRASHTAPDDAGLVVALAAVLDVEIDDVSVLQRTDVSSPHAAAEVVTCRARGAELSLWCKYGRLDRPGARHRDLAYEAEVHRTVLRPLDVRPRFVGSLAVSETTWLFTEHIADGLACHSAPDCDAALVRAAAWIGRFHARSAAFVASGAADRVERHEPAAEALRAARVADAAARVGASWVARLVDGLATVLDEALTADATVVHGDYYCDNVLDTPRGPAVVDWEWAAVGIGELDLDCLIDSWPEATAERCVAAYRDARGAASAGGDVDERLLVARLQRLLALFDVRPQWFTDDRGAARLAQLERTARALGLL